MDQSNQTATNAGEGIICPYCQMVDCPMHDVTAETVAVNRSSEKTTMTHPGIPLPMAIGGIVVIILVSHLILNRKRERIDDGRYRRFNLFRMDFFKTLVKKNYFPLLLQSISIFLFLLIIFAGLFGSQRVNIGPVLTWTIWWALLIFFILGFGSAFCAICPWEGIASLVTALSFRSRKKKMGYEMRWPKWLKNIYPAMIFFILLTWLELGLDITHSPSMTAMMGLGFVALAILVAIFFERRAFCRYVCLVGRIQGLYSLFSPFELRPESKDICRTCTTKDCYKGNDTATGCPTTLFPGALQENSYCTLCTECIRACPHDNLFINARFFAVDLLRKVRYLWDEAVLAIVLLALTSFHGLTMTPVWERLTNLLRVEFNLGPKMVFTLLMLLMMLLPILLFWFTAACARKFVGKSGPSTGKIFKAFAYSVIPIALFYHLAHNGMHFFMEGQNLLPLLSDPFGWGWDLFGTAGKKYLPLLTLKKIWWMQIIMILIGHVYGVIVSDRISRTLYADRQSAKRALIPLLITMILYSSFSVWLIAQPMEMRSGM